MITCTIARGSSPRWPLVSFIECVRSCRTFSGNRFGRCGFVAHCFVRPEQAYGQLLKSESEFLIGPSGKVHEALVFGLFVLLRPHLRAVGPV